MDVSTTVQNVPTTQVEKKDVALINLERCRKAAKQGDPEAEYNLGVMHGYGIVVEQDDEKALEFIQSSAESGYAPSQYFIGEFHRQSEDRDYEQALKYYEKAGKQGYGKAYARIGDMYCEGQGVERNYETAIVYYYKAFVRGYKYAQVKAASAYLGYRHLEDDKGKNLFDF